MIELPLGESEVNSDVFCPGFSKIIKTRAQEIIIEWSEIDKSLVFYPVEVRDVSHCLSRLKAAVSDLKKYAALLESEMIPIRCAHRPVEWDFTPWFIEKITRLHSAVESLADEIREIPSFLVLDSISCSLGVIEHCSKAVHALSDGLSVEILHEKGADECEQIKANQNINDGSEGLRSLFNKQ